MTVRLQFPALLLAAFTACIACAGHSGMSPDATPRRDGRYAFVERVAGTTTELQGTLVVLADTVMIDAMPGPCRYESRSARGGPIVYQCGEVSFEFDRIDPVRKATYSWTTTETKLQKVCVRYTTGANGQQTCAQYDTQPVEKRVVYSGTLRPRRIEASEP